MEEDVPAEIRDGASASSSSSSSMSGGGGGSLKKKWLYFAASIQEGFIYFKAFLVGQTKKMTARTEEEASQADLLASKMQVQAADAAELTKTRLH